jgi:hypothetical protein
MQSFHKISPPSINKVQVDNQIFVIFRLQIYGMNAYKSRYRL